MNSQIRLLTPRPVAILTCGEQFCPVTRFSPVSSTPLIYMVSLLQTSKTAAEMIEREEFALNFVEWEQKDPALQAGSFSGWEVNKWNDIPFTKKTSKKITSPCIEEACSGYEFTDVTYEIVGNAYVFFGTAVELFQNDGAEKPKALLYWGRQQFGKLPYSEASK